MPRLRAAARAPARKPAKAMPAKAKAAKAAKARPTTARKPARPARAAAPAEASPVLGRLGLVSLHVTDFPRAVQFYTEGLGLKEVSRVAEARWIELDAGPLRLGLHEDPQEPGHRAPGGSTGFYFFVKDVDASVAELRRRGAKVVDEPADLPYGRGATIADPDGNEIMLLVPTG